MTPLAALVLKGVGYLEPDGTPSEGLVLPGRERLSAGDGARVAPLMSSNQGGLGAEAVFKVGTAPVIVFKSSDGTSDLETEWHRLAWNFGVAPLLWVTTPQYVRIYNAYQPPEAFGHKTPLLGEFPLSVDIETALSQVGAVCGRRHVAMGGFWRSEFARPVDRRSRIDNILLHELTALLRDLVRRGVRSALAQKLVGRCIFFQYLVHRGYVLDTELEARFGGSRLHSILQNLDNTYALFRWIRTTFNGDLFPIEDEAAEREQLGHSATLLTPLSDFFGHFNISDKQGRLFPFRFDAIPVELISSIYEKFVHMADTDGEQKLGVHYTPINLVDLVLDPVFESLAPSARILDPACGSGVFLVESLRRLVWLRSREMPLTRDLVRDTLMCQIRGVDISPAALSVAAFSLYLALLELDPAPPRGLDALDCLKFEPLHNRVLFPTSTFNPHLSTRLDDSGLLGETRFDAIVGNPPWTHDPKAKHADKTLAKREREATARGEDSEQVEAEPERRSGITYARRAGVPLPPRSNDWAFLWRCLDFSNPDTRLALVMKATPFFSLERGAAERRDQLFRAFPNVSLVNLAQLRLSRLFQEYEAEQGEAKAAAGPALLFFSNCLPVDAGTVTVINLPWTPTFQNTGIFELPADPAKGMRLTLLATRPELLKTAAYGEERDSWFLERLARNKRTVTFAAMLSEFGLPAGQGYQPGSKYSADHLRGLPLLTTRDFRAMRVERNLPQFEAYRAYRAYSRERYAGPLVILPEGGLTAALERGRYTAAFDKRDVVYNESFIGVSYAGVGETFARAFSAVMNSSLIAYQLAFIGCTLGIKQTKVERVDLDNVRLPRLDLLSSAELKQLVDIEGELATTSAPSSVLNRLDLLVYEICGLVPAERALLGDAVRRARAVIFETHNDRASMDIAPTDTEIMAYARNLCQAFNEYADDPNDLALIPQYYAPASNDMVVIRFSLSRRYAEISNPISASLSEVAPENLSAALGGSELPYLKALRSLRLYVQDTLIVAKPARYRCFTPAAAWTDGDRVLADLMQPVESVDFGGAIA
ncbi:class I SAM-dependent DNA methyltransferase [Mesorhizobium sp. B1-1-8]|uniref:HsdM family class I SAM-dependent methyltransferase n=1 Tax=Mesorhizobium sp. B1-1-8 TaxID=2589976 RepID=UPI001D02924B|nr:N-6 DNA methylase [Mesorhizobium sp. B1-1-8]UCI10261.1 N-6 DNA methylase [Mesorhizobium sp. B1-1-8]